MYEKFLDKSLNSTRQTVDDTLLQNMLMRYQKK